MFRGHNFAIIVIFAILELWVHLYKICKL